MGDAISNAARAVLGALWMNPKFTLRYGMVESRPSDRALASLSELVAAGILSRQSDGQAVVYSLTEKGRDMDRRPPGTTLAEKFDFIKQHGGFPMSSPIEGRKDKGMGTE